MTLVVLLDLLRTESLVVLGTLLRASLEATLVLGLLPLPAVALPWLPATELTWATPTGVSPAPMTTRPTSTP